MNRLRGPDTQWLPIVLGVGAGVLVYAVAMNVARSYGQALLLGGPAVVGLVVGLSSQRRALVNALVCLMLLVLLSIVTLREGVVCVLFVLPVLAASMAVGVLIGTQLRTFITTRRRRRQTGALFVGLGIGWQVIEARLDNPAQHPLHEASDSVLIAAPPEAVFAALTQKPIEVPASFQWFLRLGLPIPRKLEVLEARVGGRVRIDQSFGTVHARVSELAPPRTFAYQVERYEVHDAPFHITRLGRSPHYGLRSERIEDWLSIEGTRYELSALPNGKTRLARHMTWRRHLAPAFYFGPLQQAVIERGQTRLLELIRQNVERSLDRGNNLWANRTRR